MTSLLAAVAMSSLLGSLHCAAMCGPLVTLAAAEGKGLRLPLGHAAGRLAAYLALGIAAGAMGSLVDLAGSVVNLQRTAWLLGAVAMMVSGLVALAVACGLALPRRQHRWFRRGLVQIRTRRPWRRAFSIGVLSAALPCGWLWSHAALAAGTGSPGQGGLVMATFWLGGLPVLLGLGVSAGPLVAAVRSRMPWLAGALLLVLGTSALMMRPPTAAEPTAAACHGR